MLEILAERFNYIPIIILMMIGLYVVIATGNLVKRLVGLSLFQTSVFLLYITIGKVFGGSPPIIADDGHHGEDAGHGAEAGYGAEAAVAHGADAGEHATEAADHAVDAAHQVAEIAYSNPLPHVLILTAIVVGVATLAVGLALVVRIREAYGTIEDDALNTADYSLESGSAE
ncbi:MULTISPECIES: cation:proton antiporter subunit C [Maricaulis]|jgi:multicomponent Na+:H+ antiporter subunit C|uniref:Multisubunit sodium/proton antiporter, MrpC subunit n=1 Tax=Maricaulis maris (strain MCS10) TaxID=394221 RepID=Q0ARA5_MARMM|nr:MULTISPECIES: cation:proton antiporter subunit C [Maricaulis]ABI65182.1 multisubunit sodium/proton antiporter, MrpC subunit [Maricaulis maris MCS10]MAC88723.1 NADH:quinone oxidoreductase [Maricaulis sp.]